MCKMIVVWVATLAAAAGSLADKTHPRLWFPKSSEEAIRSKISTDPLAGRLNDVALSKATAILLERTCRYEIPDGRRLLAESRLALSNIMHTAWAWRLTGDEKFRLRTIAELEAACALKDWNPSHFLDTAEMATAVATGYDWLYATLTPEQRTMCERAIVEKALKPAKKVYDQGTFWTKPRNNWSQVCGSGIAIAAAAIAGHDDGLAEDLFERGLKLVESCVAFYEPDGMYPEGPGYWHYGTDYHVMLLAACGSLDRATRDAPILRKAGEAILNLTSPTRLPFSFSDSSTKMETPSCAQSWLALKFKDPVQTLAVRNLFTRALDEDGEKFSGGNCLPLSILWLPPALPGAQKLSNAAVYHGEQAVALFRTGGGPGDAWIGIKGGTPAASHAHMDVGSFVYDAHGIRWILDPGSDDYNMPGYFGSRRYSYFRLQNRSHSTLEIDGKLQNPTAAPCPLTDSSLIGSPASATFDLSAAYPDSADKVIRSVSFDVNSGATRLGDEIEKPTGDVVWRAITNAECEVTGDSVVLARKGKQITLRRISNEGTWSITDLKPPTPQENQNKGIRAVVLTVPKADRISLTVEIRP